jgi:hypothetical protein
MHRVFSVAVVAVVLAGCSSQVTSGEPSATEGQDLSSGLPYLALGDSVPFGYNPVDAVNDPTNIHAFTGYPEVLPIAGKFAPNPIANASCEGETTGSFINVAAPDNGCQAWKAAGDAMHVTYAALSESQLEYAVVYLLEHPNTATVSIQIGANDILLVQLACEAAYSTSDPNYATEVGACEEAGIPKAIEGAAANIGYIAGALRTPAAEGGAGYTGQIVLMTYYALQYTNTSDPTFQAVYGLDTAMVELAQGYPQLGLSIGKSFSTFAVAADALGGGDACKAGLLYKLSDGTCNKHPSLAGQALLAAVVATPVPASQINLAASTPEF